MMDWTGNRTNERFRYTVASWPSLMEIGDYGNITNGSVSYKALSSVKQRCSFDFDGGTPPNTVDAVRIYYGFTDDNGDTGEVPLGTFLVSYSSIDTTYDRGDAHVSGSVEGVSMLSVLSDKIAGRKKSYAQGANAVNEARLLCESVGLTVFSDSSSYTLAQPHTFEASENYLTIVNWLLASAGFSSADVDSYGFVHFHKYVDRDVRHDSGAVWEFGSGLNSVMMDGIRESNDWQKTVNCVRLMHETESAQIVASAKCVSGSKSSLNARGGREKTLYEDATELSGSSGDEMLAKLKAKARQRLLDNSNEIIHLEWKHAYVPIKADDAVTVDYCGNRYEMALTNMDLKLVPSVPCVSSGRAFVTNDMKIETYGEIVWTI